MTPVGEAPRGPLGPRATAIALQRQRATSSTLSVGAFTLCGRFAAYGRRVSGALENRAAVFTSQPQAVEVYQSGGWWPGELLGWRHDDAGSCQVWVRVVLGGVEETAWTDLGTLRLPERHLSVAPEVAGAPGTREMPAPRGPARLRDVSANADPSATVSLPMVRERSANHPAGGRRRAPETGPVALPAAQAPAAVSAPAPARGRHRAPADPGRHRAADTGLFAVVSADAASADADTATSGPAERPDGSLTLPPRMGWTVPAGVEPDLLTRPMRLSDHAPHSRRPRVDGLRSL